MHKGRVVFGAMDEVVFGTPGRRGDRRADGPAGRAAARFLMVSGHAEPRRPTRSTKSAARSGARCVGIFDAMPPHTPREAVIAAAEQARAANADLIVTVGGGSITDGAKAVQLCLANDIRTADDIDRIRAVKGARAADERADRAPDQRADDDRRRRVLRHCRRHQRARPRSRRCCAIRWSCRAPSSSIPRSPCTRRNGCGSRPASAPSIIASRASARARPIPTPTRRR